LSVSAYGGAPLRRRSVTSSAVNALALVLSWIGSTTRDPDQASHPQDSVVFTPPMSGPSPKSYVRPHARLGPHGGAPAPGLELLFHLRHRPAVVRSEAV
jgi:hypothetical protein